MLNNVAVGPGMHRNPSESIGRVPEGIMIGHRAAREKEDLSTAAWAPKIFKDLAFPDFPSSLCISV